MKKITLGILLTPSIVHAAAGMADRFDEHQHCFFPAYAYCLLFGIIILFGLFIAMLVYKDRIDAVTERISSYMKKHPFWAILFIGISLTIPVGIMGSISWEILWFFAISPFLGMLGLFPAVLLCKYPKEKILLSPLCIKWSIMISLSAIIASLLFIILTNYHLLPGTEKSITEVVSNGVYGGRLQIHSHPNNSIKEIWGMVPIFLFETALSLVLYGIGRLFKIVIRKIKQN